MYLTNYLFVLDPSSSFFMIPDSIQFWNNSDFRMDNLSNLMQVYEGTKDATIGYRFFNFITLFLSYFSQLFDENNILVQKLFNVFIGAFSVPYIYMMFRKFFNKKLSYKFAIIYLFVSYNTIYSVVLFRDCYVYLLYVIGSYLLLYYERQNYILFKFLLIFVLLLGFRIEHALFFLMFILVCLYLKSKKNKSIIIVFFILLPVALITLAPVLIDNMTESTNAYTRQALEKNENNNSMGAKLNKLPPGARHILLAINSQIAPVFPPWRAWFSKVNSTHAYENVQGYRTPWRFMEGFGAVFMVVCWIFILYSLSLGKYKKLPRDLKFLFLISVIFLLVASTVVNPRRVYCIYPIIYLVAMYGYVRIPYKKQRILNRRIVFGFFCLFTILIFKTI